MVMILDENDNTMGLSVELGLQGLYIESYLMDDSGNKIGSFFSWESLQEEMAGIGALLEIDTCPVEPIITPRLRDLPRLGIIALLDKIKSFKEALIS